MLFSEKLSKILDRYDELEQYLSASEISDVKQYAKLSKEFSDLKPVAAAIQHHKSLETDLMEYQAILKNKDADKELREMVEEDLSGLKQRIEESEHAIKILLLPKDVDDEKNVILEIRAGTGGEEASLFAGDLLRMYQRFADMQGWKNEIIELHESDTKGVKEAVVNVSGKGVFARLKYESGVHRVQRVPATEASGRIHTSAATVAVLPEAEEMDVSVEEKDLQIDTYRASGAGGQHVNTTDSAVRITHIPTGIVVQCQDERSQHKNKAKALKVLRSKIYEVQRMEIMKQQAESRKDQVGSGDRSERIRTYNFPQGRVTDHRINLTLYKLELVMEGDMNELIEGLISHDQAQRLAAL